MTKVGEIVEEHTLTGIELVAAPSKTSYYEGEKLDLTGLQIKGQYLDTKNEEITTGYTVDKTENLVATDKVVTVTYETFTVTFNIEVIAQSDITAITEDKTIKTEAENIDTTHMTNNGKGFIENNAEHCSEGNA